MGGKGVPGKQDIDISFFDETGNCLVCPGMDDCRSADKDDLTS
jgi:hypothetical protein